MGVTKTTSTRRLARRVADRSRTSRATSVQTSPSHPSSVVSPIRVRTGRISRRIYYRRRMVTMRLRLDEPCDGCDGDGDGDGDGRERRNEVAGAGVGADAVATRSSVSSRPSIHSSIQPIHPSPRIRRYAFFFENSRWLDGHH